MSIQIDLNEDILLAISNINEDSPELNQYLDEMPIHGSNISHSGITNSELCDYLNSLKKVSQRYSQDLDRK